MKRIIGCVLAILLIVGWLYLMIDGAIRYGFLEGVVLPLVGAACLISLVGLTIWLIVSPKKQTP